MGWRAWSSLSLVAVLSGCSFLFPAGIDDPVLDASASAPGIDGGAAPVDAGEPLDAAASSDAATPFADAACPTDAPLAPASPGGWSALTSSVSREIFAASPPLSAGQSPHYIAVADVDQNGLDDIVVPTGDGLQLLVLFHDERGRVPVPVSVSTNPPPNVVSDGLPWDVAVGSFSRRARGAPLEIAVVKRRDRFEAGTGAVMIFGVTASRQLVFRAAYDGGTFPERLIAADVDGDGLDEIVVENSDGTELPPGCPSRSCGPQSTLIYPSRDGWSCELSSGAPFGHAAAVTAADFDGDGWLDIAGGEDGPGVTLFLRSGCGLCDFTPVRRTYSGRIRGMTAGDLNGDGLADLAFTALPGQVLLLFQDPRAAGDWPMGDPVVLRVPMPWSIARGHLGARGRPFLVVSPEPGNGAQGATVITNLAAAGTATGAFAVIQANITTPERTTGLAVGRLDDDALDDFVISDESAGMVRVFPQSP